jgi:CrcB protein
MNFALVFIGGGIGSVARYLIGLAFQKANYSLPVSTMIANITACVIFAVTLNAIETRSDSSNVKLLVLTGICGGLSTFSTFGYETFLLLKQQNYTWMLVNIVASIVLCTSCFILIKK